MDWKRIIALLVAVVILGILIYFGVTWFMDYTNPEKKKAWTDCETKDIKFQELCWMNAASQFKDTSFCDKVSDKEHREICVGRVGVFSNNPSLCDKISNQSIRAECHLAFLQQANK